MDNIQKLMSITESLLKDEDSDPLHALALANDIETDDDEEELHVVN